MGAVYDAWDVTLGVRCAIKENLIFTEANQRQFEREAQLLARLHHPNLPRVTDHYLIPHQGQYLVMDFVEGDDLRQRLEQHGPLPEADIRRWADDILNALIYLHKRGIIHRDIKPANIRINDDGAAVLVDFGIAKELDDTTGRGVTTAGARGMTPGFAPPEQYGLGSGRTDARSDLYSLAATLYTLLSGEVPADALSRIQQPSKFVPLSRRALSISPTLAGTIDRALELEPEARFASAAEMQAALRGELPTQIPSPAPTITRAEPAPSPSRLAPWLKWWPWGGVALIGLIVLGIAYFSGASPLGPSASPSPTTEFVATATPTPSPSPSATVTPVAPTATPTQTPSPTLTPTITRTPVGGGLGKIAFVSDRDGINEIYVMNVDGSEVRRLTDNTVDDNSPAWSPDGSQIAFISRRDGNREVYVMNANGTGQTRLTFTPEAEFYPAWSPDGQTIVFSSARDGNGELYVMNADGSEQTRLTFIAGDDFDPAWSPDGQRIAFTSSRLSVSDIYVMNSDGSRTVRLADTSKLLGESPVWSPDGTRIMFVAWRGPKRELYVMGVTGRSPLPLTSAPAHASGPDWSPDGTRIVFVSDGATDLEITDATKNEIYVMNADGTGRTRLTENEFTDFAPAWSP